MTRSVWPLKDGRPIIRVDLPLPNGGSTARTLLADTGAGTARSEFELVLDEEDCLLTGAFPCDPVRLRGAYEGVFRVYLLCVRVPGIPEDQDVRAIGVEKTPAGLDGIACFRFLNRFRFGNFGDPDLFGIENLGLGTID